MYTQMHKWLPAVNKQKFTHPTPKLRGGVAIGGEVVETEFVHCYNYSVVDLQIICVSEGMLHWFTQFIRHSSHFNQNRDSKRAVC